MSIHIRRLPVGIVGYALFSFLVSLSFFRALPLALTFVSSFIAANGQNAGVTGAKYGSLASPAELGISNLDNDVYTVDIVLGGQNFTVMVDTGSTDLWVYANGRDIQFSNTTDVIAAGQYAIGAVKGNVAFADLQIGPYVVPNQAFINASSSDLPGGLDGIMGVAFETLAMIPNLLSQAWGDDAAYALGTGVASSLLAQDRSTPGYVDLQLGRLDGNGTDRGGHFLAGQHAPGLEAVANAPKLEQIDINHWTILMDGASINGKPFSFNKSGVASVPAGKLAVTLDTGYTSSVFPDAFVDAIYSSIPGAVKYTGAIPGTDNGPGNNWIVPCNASTNITFVFNGQEYPVNPRDAVTFYQGIKVDTLDGVDLVANTTLCANRFFAGDADETYDMILGMGFLRNVYASFNYGDYRPGKNTTGQKPYVQLLSTSERDAAWADFNAFAAYKLATGPPSADPRSVLDLITTFASLAVNATSGADASAATSPGSSPSPTATATATATSVGSPAASAAPDASASVASTNGVAEAQDLAVAGAVSDASPDDSSKDDSNKYGPIALGLLGANVALGLVILGVTLAMCMRGAKEKREARYKPIRLPKSEAAPLDIEGGARYSD